MHQTCTPIFISFFQLAYSFPLVSPYLGFSSGFEVDMGSISLNFIRFLRVVITPLLRGENNSKQSDEFQARAVCKSWWLGSQLLKVIQIKLFLSNLILYPHKVVVSKFEEASFLTGC